MAVYDTNKPKRMRVALYGNVCNSLYQLGVALREHSDIDAHLFLDVHSDPQMRPESDTPALRSGYPDWIHEGDFFPRWQRIFPWRSSLVQELKQFDVIVVSSNGPMVAHFAGRPSCFFVTGADLIVMPFPLMYSFRYKSLRSKADATICGLWQRLGIRRVTEIWSQPYSPFTHSLEEIGAQRNQLQNVYLPLPIDADALSPEVRNDGEHARRMRGDFDFVVFHPSRLMIRGNDRLPKAHADALIKRNDVLLRGFAAFLHRTNANAALALIDRDASPDRDVARAIADELRIGDRVLWLKPPRPAGFTRAELAELYAAADVVADDFGVGWFGSVVLEALAIGRPVLSYIDERVMRTLYPWHPIVSAQGPTDVAEQLSRLHSTPELRTKIGRSGRAWIEQFHSNRRVARLYFDQFRALAQRLELPEPSWTAATEA